MLDGRWESSNNPSERSIKPFVIDRNNFLFANSKRRAKASAITYRILETTKANNLNPFAYLKYIFELLPFVSFKENPSLLKNHLPWAA